MAEAQNARKLLTWLQNPNVPTSIDELPRQLDQQLTNSEKERLSIVRLRETSHSQRPRTKVTGLPA